MPEVMAIERLVQLLWELDGYFTVARMPYRTVKGGRSDIDVVAYEPAKSEVVAIECKLHWGPTHYYRIKSADVEEALSQRLYWGSKKPTSLRWVLDQLTCVEVRRALHDRFGAHRHDRFIFYGNVRFDDERVAQQCQELYRSRGHCVEIVPIHELVRQLMLRGARDALATRTRYGDTALELIRNLVRSVANGLLDLGEIEERIKEEVQWARTQTASRKS